MQIVLIILIRDKVEKNDSHDANSVRFAHLYGRRRVWD